MAVCYYHSALVPAMFIFAGSLASLSWGHLPGTSSAVQITRVMVDMNTRTTLSGDYFKCLEDSFLSKDEDGLVAR